MKDLDINFPLENFEKLIKDIGWESLDDWFDFWNNQKNILSIDKYWNHKVTDDWICGLALPLLSQAYKYQNNFSDRTRERIRKKKEKFTVLDGGRDDDDTAGPPLWGGKGGPTVH